MKVYFKTKDKIYKWNAKKCLLNILSFLFVESSLLLYIAYFINNI